MMNKTELRRMTGHGLLDEVDCFTSGWVDEEPDFHRSEIQERKLVMNYEYLIIGNKIYLFILNFDLS